MLNKDTIGTTWPRLHIIFGGTDVRFNRGNGALFNLGMCANYLDDKFYCRKRI